MSESLTGPPPPFFIRLFAQVATGLHYLESVGAMVVLWLCPSLTPEPRIHQFISASPVHHRHRHHHHHHHVSHRSDVIMSQSDPTSSILSEGSNPTVEDLERVDQALKEQERERQKSDSTSQILRWRDGQQNVEEEDSILEWKERPPSGVSATELPCV
ncbi:hypothetical protein CVT25_014848 [Psilocybe cyanescens]|uniref:Uncharacterized protein n=1 Tax=Psilocybe cyanescens TaxID=93625 RepID=A0A409WEY8_PSICY|nr:hypothetical protein CVT25_014848 [Psilocybe cyanescens]